MNTSDKKLNELLENLEDVSFWLNTVISAYMELDQTVPLKLSKVELNIEKAIKLVENVKDELHEERLISISNFTKESLRTQLVLLDSCKNTDKETLETLTPMLKTMFNL